MPERLAVSGLPCGLCEPLLLLGLEPTGEQPAVCVKETCRGPSPAIAEVTIPLTAWVRDARGRTCCGSTELTVCVRISGACLDARGTFMATASVRLIDVEACACRPVFDVRVQVNVEVFMVRMAPRGRGCDFPHPPMPPRPFYPQPWYY